MSDQWIKIASIRPGDLVAYNGEMLTVEQKSERRAPSPFSGHLNGETVLTCVRSDMLRVTLVGNFQNGIVALVSKGSPRMLRAADPAKGTPVWMEIEGEPVNEQGLTLAQRVAALERRVAALEAANRILGLHAAAGPIIGDAEDDDETGARAGFDVDDDPPPGGDDDGNHE